MFKVFYKNRWFKAETKAALALNIKSQHPKDTRESINNFIKLRARESQMKEGIKFNQLIAGAEAVVNVTAGNIVDQGEINRRAGICSSCKIKDEEGNFYSGVISTNDCRACGFASRLSNWVNKIKKVFKANYTIPNGLQDKGCTVCKCSLMVMLPSRMSAFNYEKEKEFQDKRPEHCWVKLTSQNHKP